MAQMNCNCGNRMSTVIFPNYIEGEIKGIFEYKTRSVWQCGFCGRLWIDVDDPEVKGCHISKSYLPEDGKSGDLFEIGKSEEYIKYLKDLWILNKNEFLKIEIGEL